MGRLFWNVTGRAAYRDATVSETVLGHPFQRGR